MEYVYKLEMKVRDYECDLQGIVNNANYQHYYEHTRHEFLREHGIDFAQMHAAGIDFVVARLTMSYKMPLRSGDAFQSVLNVEREGIKYVFKQKIYRISDGKLCNLAYYDCVVLDHGQLALYEPIDKMIENLKL